MLDALRKGAGTWVAKIFIAVLVLSFAVWGIADIFSGRQSDALAVVGEEEITEREYTDAFQRDLQQLSQRLGQQLSADQARQLGLDRQVLQRLISQAALDNKVRELNLAVADEAVAEQIVKDPLFQNSSGSFDRSRFQQLLASNGLSEEGYVYLERRNLLRGAIAGVADSGVSVPDEMVKAIHRQQNETRTARYFTLPATAAGEIPTPSEDQLRAFYDNNKRRFAAPEFRALNILRLEPGDLANTIDVSDEELRQLYEERSQEFVTPEQRYVEQIPFTTMEEAAAARQEIANGKDFIELAKERGLKPVDYTIGKVAKSGIADRAIADAAFALDGGEVSDPVKGALSIVLLRARDIEPEQRQSFDEVKDTLRQQLALERAQEEVVNMHDVVEDARAGGSTLAEIAAAQNLPLIQVAAVDREGNSPDGEAIEELPARDQLLRVAFESGIGVENDPLDTENDGFAWVDVAEVTPEAIRPFEEVKDEAATMWAEERRREVLFKKATDIVEKGRAGTPIDQLAAVAGQSVETSKPMRRRDAEDVFTQAALANLFRQGPNGFSLAPLPDDGGFLIMQVGDINVPAFDPQSKEAEALRNQLAEGIGSDLLQQYIAGLQDRLGISVNSQMWNRINGQS